MAPICPIHSPDLGIFRQARVQATSSALSGTRNWEFHEAPSIMTLPYVLTGD
ncbi:MAG: hypothetical protein IPI65_17405 [Bacteroidetes bacterium]|nr:hypothetical protein [Bacteroidota bacterium]